jgi:integrase
VASRVFKVAKRAGWVAANPIPDEKGELVERREPVQPVPLRSIAQVLRHAPAALGDLIRFAAKTGCRQEEAAGLERQHVDLKAGTITFARTKTAAPRVIPMTPSMRRLLVRALATGDRRSNAPPDQPVFRNREGSRFLGMPSRWRELVRGAGVPIFRMHDLRHTYAIRWLQAGGSIYPLSRRLGHSTVRTTEIYAAWLTDRAH